MGNEQESLFHSKSGSDGVVSEITTQIIRVSIQQPDTLYIDRKSVLIVVADVSLFDELLGIVRVSHFRVVSLGSIICRIPRN